MKGPISSRVQYSKWNFTTIVRGSKFQVMVISIIGLVRKIMVYSSLYCLMVPSEIWRFNQHWLNRATVFSRTIFQTREQEYFSFEEWGTQGYCSAMAISPVSILCWVLHAFLGYIIVVVWFFLNIKECPYFLH
jgi:hypothetical protein